MGLFGGKTDSKPGESSPAAPRERSAPRTSPSASRSSVDVPTVIGKETTVKGELKSDTDMLIEGRVEGQIHGAKHVIVGETGDVEARIDAQVVTVRGKVTGDCDASKKFEITATGKVYGNISARAIVVAEGATFRGSSKMTTEPRSAKREDTQELEKVAEPAKGASSPPAATTSAPPSEPRPS